MRDITCAFAIILACTVPMCAGSQTSKERSKQHEQFKNAIVQYEWVKNPKGQRIRTILTRPRKGNEKVPAIFFVGWLSCDSVEYVNGETDAFGAIFWRLVETSGYATMRMDKPGVGESD